MRGRRAVGHAADPGAQGQAEPARDACAAGPGIPSEPGKGVNAIQAAGEAVAYVAAEARRLAQEGPFEDGFDPPHTTIHVGTIQGGTILNIIPERCEFIMEWRTIPGDDATRHVERMRQFVADTIEPAMQAVNPNTGFDFEVMTHDAGPVARSRSRADRASSSSSPVRTAPARSSYGTEGGYYQDAGIPTIICGPGHIAQAHQPDEWIAQDQLDACDAFIRRLVDRVLV